MGLKFAPFLLIKRCVPAIKTSKPYEPFRRDIFSQNCSDNPHLCSTIDRLIHRVCSNFGK